MAAPPSRAIEIAFFGAGAGSGGSALIGEVVDQLS
jgi:hypothetical protein